MPKSSKLAPIIRVKGMALTDPRIVMRVLIGALLAANLVAAVFAFKPFGGSAADLREDEMRLSAQLRQAQGNVEKGKQTVARVDIARTQGDKFLSKYIMDKREASAITVEELNKAASEAGIRAITENASYEPIEGSDTLQMMAILAEFQGTYAGLTKLMNLLEKSDRFLIIDYMTLNAPQEQNNRPGAASGQQQVNVSVRLLTFVRDETGSLE
jgi:hypothetical protein